MRDPEIQQVREFNRFYTNFIGLLDQHLWNSEFSLPEARVLYELYHRQPCTASSLINELVIDKGYLSRILALFKKKGLLQKKKNKEDARVTLLALTANGNEQFEKINRASVGQIKDMLEPLSVVQKNELLRNMKSIQQILKVVSYDAK